MKKNLSIGILNETKEHEKRAPLTPRDVKFLIKKGVAVEVESSAARVFKDEEYRKSGARVVNRFQNAFLLIGIKTPKEENLYRNKIYMIFSHTMKGQSQSLPFLKVFLKKKNTLIDYEDIADSNSKRLVYFGRFAGICGIVDSLCYMGKKLQHQGTENPFSSLKPSHEYGSLKSMKQAVTKLNNQIRRGGIEKFLCPFIIGITGHGNASRGAQEILDLLNPVAVHPESLSDLMKCRHVFCNRIYKIVFQREEKIRSKDGKSFYFEDYLRYPKRFESNLDRYIPYINILIHTSYWDKRYPKMVTKRMVNRLSRRRPFRLGFVGDVSCDINGSIELTHKTTTQANPVFTYDPQKRKFADGYERPGISILAVDNLPAELPKDASREFSALIRDYVYQIAVRGAKDIAHDTALPAEIRRAVIIEKGKLTKDFRYMRRYL